jgi:hydrogenase maturation protease
MTARAPAADPGASRLLVVGLGNRDRGDDAAGPRVVDLVRRRRPPGVDTMVVEGSIVDLALWWRPTDRVVLVDAAAPAGTPGRLTRIDVTGGRESGGRGDELAAGRAWSTHGVDLGTAVEVARALDRMPAQLVVLAIEGVRFGLGDEIDGAVERGVHAAAAMVSALADAMPVSSAG